MKMIGSGAEAVIHQDGSNAIKHRLKKGYRIAEIDEKLRSSRTRREANIMQKLSAIGFPCPKVIKEQDKQGKLEMGFISGDKIRDILESSDYTRLCKEIGKKIAIMHNSNIIHGDLTTSNMILHEGEVFFIDFGLSFMSERVEDRAVDLHLLRQALESKHYRIWEKAYAACIDGYKAEAKRATEILHRLEVVELRGRYKQQT